MSELRRALENYLTIRRSLGFELREPGRLLPRFVTFADAENADFITTKLALRWARLPVDVQPATWAGRLAMVRQFAIWHAAADPRTQVPPKGLLSHRYRRKPPYIYTDDELERLVLATQQLRSNKGLRAHTYSTLFGLLALTGMRINEALGLDREDVDLDRGILTLRQAKLGKSRLVPVHASSQQVLVNYAEMRNRVLPGFVTPAFFVSEKSTRITEWSTRYNFAKVSQQIGLREASAGHGHGPRIHDMRHRFAVRTLIDWYRAGVDVEREIPKLSTYLGHVHVSDTYWYIEAVPELLQLATERCMQKRGEEGS